MPPSELTLNDLEKLNFKVAQILRIISSKEDDRELDHMLVSILIWMSHIN